MCALEVYMLVNAQIDGTAVIKTYEAFGAVLAEHNVGEGCIWILESVCGLRRFVYSTTAQVLLCLSQHAVIA